MDNFEQVTDPSYLDWMKKKSANSKDPEERMALNDLFDMIKDIQRKQELSDLTKEREAREAAEAEKERLAAAEAEADKGRALSNAGKKSGRELIIAYILLFRLERSLDR